PRRVALAMGGWDREVSLPNSFMPPLRLSKNAAAGTLPSWTGRRQDLGCDNGPASALTVKGLEDENRCQFLFSAASRCSADRTVRVWDADTGRVLLLLLAQLSQLRD